MNRWVWDPILTPRRLKESFLVGVPLLHLTNNSQWFPEDNRQQATKIKDILTMEAMATKEWSAGTDNQQSFL